MIFDYIYLTLNLFDDFEHFPRRTLPQVHVSVAKVYEAEFSSGT